MAIFKDTAKPQLTLEDINERHCDMLLRLHSKIEQKGGEHDDEYRLRERQLRREREHFTGFIDWASHEIAAKKARLATDVTGAWEFDLEAF